MIAQPDGYLQIEGWVIAAFLGMAAFAFGLVLALVALSLRSRSGRGRPGFAVIVVTCAVVSMIGGVGMIGKTEHHDLLDCTGPSEPLDECPKSEDSYTPQGVLAITFGLGLAALGVQLVREPPEAKAKDPDAHRSRAAT